MPLSIANVLYGNFVLPGDIAQFFYLLTGVMTDQPVALGNTLSVSGGITGTLSTAAQPNVTSLGILASPHMTGPVVDSGGLTITGGGLTVTGNSTITGTLGGISTLTATTLAGTLSTAAQPSVTSVGILAAPHLTSPVVDSGGLTVTSGGLTVTGNSTITGTLGGIGTLTATTLAGTLSTAAQPNLTSVGILAALHMTGPVVDSGGLAITTGGLTISAGGLTVSGNSTITGTLGGITTLTATTLAGTLSTAAQPSVTSVGILASPHLTSPVVDSGGLVVTAGNLSLSGVVDMQQVATPASPGVGRMRVYPKADGNLYTLGNTGVERAVGTGTGGGGGSRATVFALMGV